MRRILFFMVMAFSLSANAQVKMMIHLSGGDVRIYDKTDVDSVTYDVQENIDKHNGHEAVDLGLPSGLKWATCNIGADTPEGYGDMYGWGETETRAKYGDANKHIVSDRIVKYNVNEEQGPVDGKTVLDQEDDVAHTAWGGTWRMPTREEVDELCSNCNRTEEKTDGIKGTRFTGPNGNSIFMPLSGFSIGSSRTSAGGVGYYWTASLSADIGDCTYAYILKLTGSDGETSWQMRRDGCAVRAVISGMQTAGKQEIMKVHRSNGAVDVYKIAAVDSVIFNTLYDNSKYNGHEFVDLGLPSGLKWAACNVGADAPEEYGNYYEWGETAPRDEYSRTNRYFADDFSETDALLKYNVNSLQGNVDNKTVLDPEDDAAHVAWGGAWRMPTDGEHQELRNNCRWEETTLNGVNVTKITGPNGNCIYLPYTGHRVYGETVDEGTEGYYWTSTLKTKAGEDWLDYCSFAEFFSVPYSLGSLRRSTGAAVRAVAE